MDGCFDERSASMTELRKRMVQDRTIRGFTPETQDKYLEAVEALARHYQRPPDRLIPEQIREYLLYLIETRPRAKSTFRVHLSALKFLYRWTLGWSWPIWALPRIQSDKKRPVVLRRVEVWCLLDHVRKPSARRSLTLMDTCGLRVSQALHLRVQDIDSRRMVVWVRHSRDSRTGQTKTLTLEAQEFLRRFLPQVLPRGVHKVRYYGLWSPSRRDQLHAWQEQLVPASGRPPRAVVEPTSCSPPRRPCPYCRTGILVYVRRLPPQGRSPP
jgi:site-specific recombinase XerD